MVGLGQRKGFTLIEVVLAMTIISIAVLALVSSISFTTSKSLNAEVVSTAQQLAQERMEFLTSRKRDVGYTAPELAIGTTTEPPLAVPFAAYTRTTEVCLVDASLATPDCDPALPNPDIGYKRITVNVTYVGLPDVPTPAASLVTVVANVRE